MAQRRRQSEKNEKAVRDLMKIEANKVCFDCTEKRPMYICLELATFVCQNCAGLHRNQKRKVKGIGLSEFSDEEVERLRRIGNEGAAKVWLATWTPAAFPKPESGNNIQIERFMRMKYEERRWYRPVDSSSAPQSAAPPAAAPPASAGPSFFSNAPQTQPPPQPAAPAGGFFGESAPAPAPAPTQPAPAPVPQAAPAQPGGFFFGAAPTAAPAAAPAPAPATQPAAQPTQAADAELLDVSQPAKQTGDDLLAMFSNPQPAAPAPAAVPTAAPTQPNMMPGGQMMNPMMMNTQMMNQQMMNMSPQQRQMWMMMMQQQMMMMQQQMSQQPAAPTAPGAGAPAWGGPAAAPQQPSNVWGAAPTPASQPANVWGNSSAAPASSPYAAGAQQMPQQSNPFSNLGLDSSSDANSGGAAFNPFA